MVAELASYMGPHNIVTSTSHHNRESNSHTLWVMVLSAIFNNISVVSSPAYGVYISHLIRYSRDHGYDHDFLDKLLLLTRTIPNQGFLVDKLKSSLRMFYGRHHELVNCKTGVWPHALRASQHIRRNRIVRSRASKKDRLCKCQNKKEERTNNYLQNITKKTKDRATRTKLKTVWTRVLWKGKQSLLGFIHWLAPRKWHWSPVKNGTFRQKDMISIPCCEFSIYMQGHHHLHMEYTFLAW
jgi:hypothetical protein